MQRVRHNRTERNPILAVLACCLARPAGHDQLTAIMRLEASGNVVDHGLLMGQHSSRSFPLKLSQYPFSQGLPGSMYSLTIPGPLLSQLGVIACHSYSSGSAQHIALGRVRRTRCFFEHNPFLDHSFQVALQRSAVGIRTQALEILDG